MSILAAISLASSLLGCAQELADAEPQPPSLLLVTLDTTRADRLGCYGYEGARTPHLDDLARQGQRFQRAYTPVPLTTPAHATILTGLLPTRHGIHTNGDAVLASEVETLAERLAAQGYRTAASVASFTTASVWQLDQGFGAYYDRLASERGRVDRWAQERPANEVVDDALAWLEEQGTDPWFLWVHFFDPHDPYDPPEPWATRFASCPYDGELAFVDQELGRLLRALEDRQAPESLVRMVVGDHGEALESEHGERSHGLFIFEPTMRVPFVVHAPGRAYPPAAIEQPVSLTDVLPTALSLLGLPAPSDTDGRDLDPLLRGEEPAHPGIYLESYTALRRFGYHAELGWVSGSLKLVDTPDARLYDVLQDPAEERNLLEAQPAAAQELRRRLAEVRARSIPMDRAQTPAPELAQRLEALGYLDGGYDLQPAQPPRIDAKLRVRTIKELEELRLRARQPGQLDEIIAAYQRLSQREPQLLEASMGLARALQTADRGVEAIGIYRAALERLPGSVVLMVNLANALAAEGLLAEGLACMEKVLERVPDDDLARVGILRMLSDLGRREEALQRVQVWLEQEPRNPSLQAICGVLLTQLESPQLGERHLLASLDDGVPRQHVRRSLALAAYQRGELRSAADHMRREAEAFPRSRESRKGLARLLMELRQWEEAATELRYLAEDEPGDLQARLDWAQCVFNLGDYQLADTVLQPALQRAPDDPHLLLLQANILGKQGDMAAGEALYQRARRLRQLELEAPAQRP